MLHSWERSRLCKQGQGNGFHQLCGRVLRGRGVSAGVSPGLPLGATLGARGLLGSFPMLSEPLFLTCKCGASPASQGLARMDRDPRVKSKTVVLWESCFPLPWEGRVWKTPQA